jgi:putative ABC transport system permease protein
MFGYYLDLAWRSLRRSPVLTFLMVLAIGLGIGASMTMLTVLHVMSDDPMPGRSAHLFVPHLDPLPGNYQRDVYGPDPSVNFAYPDAMAILSAHRATYQAAMAGGKLLARPDVATDHAFYVDGRYTTPEFFPMFGVTFLRGGGWTQAEEAARERVVVLNETLSRKLFGTVDSVGRIAHLGDVDLRVVGVTADWHPAPMFYVDAAASAFSNSDQFFVPLATAMDLNFDIDGNESGWGKNSIGLTSPTMTWLQVWVQLNDASQVSAFQQFLFDYSAQQKKLGHFEQPPTNAHLYNLMDWMAYQGRVPSDVRLQLWLALAFLTVCVLNIVALLLAKFLRRGGEISVRRALGARRRDIFVQLGVESLVIGVFGGTLGLVLTQVGLWSVRQRPDDYAHLAYMDANMLVRTFLVAICASVLAGLMPAWRACRIAPALQLKTQ